MVNLPDHEGIFDEPKLTTEGIEDAMRTIEVQQEAERHTQRVERNERRLQLSELSYQRKEDGQIYASFKLVSDDGAIFRTQQFVVPMDMDIRNAESYSHSNGDVVIRLANGDSFVVTIEHMERPMDHYQREFYGEWTTPPATRVGSARGFVFDEVEFFGTSVVTSCKKKPYGITLPKNMKCAFCNEHIHYPEKLVELLGEDGAKDYLKYCKKSKTKAQLFCCGCYDFIKDKPKIYGALNKLNTQLSKFVDINKRDKELKLREKELDKQLNKIKNKKDE